MSGFDISLLAPGTLVSVTTARSVYLIWVISDKEIDIQGGKYFPAKTRTRFIGSAFGETMFRTNWIGPQMRMEISKGDQFVFTSAVQSARISGDGWHYDLDWSLSPDPSE